MLPVLLGPFDSGRKVADNVLEPDIDALLRVALDGNGDTPLEVSRNRTVVKALFDNSK